MITQEICAGTLGPAIDPAEFRRTLGTFATGVTVVTTADASGRPHGLTANAFSSLSLNPPLVLVCVDHQTDTFPLLSKSEHFGVNVLTRDQEHLSRRFASKSPDKFLGVPYRSGYRGIPVLEGVLATLQCAIIQRHAAGDHTIFIGEVRQLDRRDGQPLLFYQGRYGALSTAD